MTDLFAYKLLTQDQWLAWKETGILTGAPVDLADGYIHLSTREQARETGEKWFADTDPLILVMVDLVALGDTVKWEPSRGGALFPHVYGTIPMGAVAGNSKLRLQNNGRHDWPAGF
jgi:uncharacterized protein (DUF952 family)